LGAPAPAPKKALSSKEIDGFLTSPELGDIDKTDDQAKLLSLKTRAEELKKDANATYKELLDQTVSDIDARLAVLAAPKIDFKEIDEFLSEELKDIDKIDDKTSLLFLKKRAEELKKNADDARNELLDKAIINIDAHIASLATPPPKPAPKIDLGGPAEFKEAFDSVRAVITNTNKLKKFLLACDIAASNVKPEGLSKAEFEDIKNKLKDLKELSPKDDETKETIKEDAEEIIAIVEKISPEDLDKSKKIENVRLLLNSVTRRGNEDLHNKINRMFYILSFDVSSLPSV
jgi:hypothetical protein